MRISAIPSNTADAMFVTEHAGLNQEAAQNGLSVYWNGPNREPGISRQIALVEKATEAKDFGIVLSPSAPFALNTVVERALAANIPVVILGPQISLARDVNLSFVTTDVSLTGSIAAQRIHAIVGDIGEIALVGIDPMEPGSTEYARSFEAALAKEAPQVRIASRLIGTFGSNQSERLVKEALEKHSRIAAIYALDLSDLRGAVGAIHSLGGDGRSKVIGNNEALDVLYDMRHGTVDSLIVQDMRAMGSQAVRNLIAARQHQPISERTVFNPFLVTRQNLDTEEIQQRLKLDWRSAN